MCKFTLAQVNSILHCGCGDQELPQAEEHSSLSGVERLDPGYSLLYPLEDACEALNLKFCTHRDLKQRYSHSQERTQNQSSDSSPRKAKAESYPSRGQPELHRKPQSKEGGSSCFQNIP